MHSHQIATMDQSSSVVLPTTYLRVEKKNMKLIQNEIKFNLILFYVLSITTCFSLIKCLKFKKKWIMFHFYSCKNEVEKEKHTVTYQQESFEMCSANLKLSFVILIYFQQYIHEIIILTLFMLLQHPFQNLIVP